MVTFVVLTLKIRAWRTGRFHTFSNANFEEIDVLKLFLRAALLTASMTSGAVAQQFHDLPNCEHETGLAMVRYTFGGGHERIDLSEICVDRESGTVLGAETVTGLQLVKQSGTSEEYENLDLDVAAQRRPLMQIAPVIHQTYHGGAVDDSSPEFYFINRGGPSAQLHSTNKFQMSGYLYDQLASPETLAQQFSTLIFAELFMGEEGQKPGIQVGMYSGLLFSGEAAFSNGTSVIAVTEYPDEGLGMQNGDGTIRITVDSSGRLTGAGELYVENSRLAGHAPGEWIWARLTINDLHGHAVGETGQVLKAYGVAEGELEDEGGSKTPIIGTVQFFAYDSSLFQ